MSFYLSFQCYIIMTFTIVIFQSFTPLRGAIYLQIHILHNPKVYLIVQINLNLTSTMISIKELCFYMLLHQ